MVCRTYDLYVRELFTKKKKKKKKKENIFINLSANEGTGFSRVVLLYINFTSMQSARSVQVVILIHRPQTCPWQFV
jgi:hypothetical protein